MGWIEIHETIQSRHQRSPESRVAQNVPLYLSSPLICSTAAYGKRPLRGIGNRSNGPALLSQAIPFLSGSSLLGSLQSVSSTACARAWLEKSAQLNALPWPR